MVADKHEVSFWDDGCVLKLTVVIYTHSFVNTAEVSEVHSLNGRTVWHMNYISIKLLKKDPKSSSLRENADGVPRRFSRFQPG